VRRDYLVDTSFLSAIFPDPDALPAKLRSWVIENEYRLHLSIVVIAEIVAGAENLRQQRAFARADAYENWLARSVENFAERILPIDVEVAYCAGRLLGRARAKGVLPGFADVAIAATAEAHGLIVLTRNLKHFVPLGVACFDPFAPA
jgi:predicted nucleic acid-binding protein